MKTEDLLKAIHEAASDDKKQHPHNDDGTTYAVMQLRAINGQLYSYKARYAYCTHCYSKWDEEGETRAVIEHMTKPNNFVRAVSEQGKAVVLRMDHVVSFENIHVSQTPIGVH